MPLLVLVIGWILTIFLGILAFIVLWKIVTNQISLRYLISDELGYASLSRFQFLLFTFVIAMTKVNSKNWNRERLAYPSSSLIK